MTRVQPDASWRYFCGKGNDDGRPYVVQIDTDGNLITASSIVDASDVTYTPAVDADWDGSTAPGNQNLANDQLAERVKDLETDTLSVLLPRRAFWFHDTSFVVTGNALTLAALSTQVYDFVAYQNAAANGDVTINSCILATGAYTIQTFGVTSIDRGKVDISFKHVNDAGYTSIVAGQDWYAGSPTVNVAKTATFTVVTSGRHIFKFTINGKNVSSSGYLLTLTKIDIYLTAGDS